jgi:hypothetical protein
VSSLLVSLLAVLLIVLVAAAVAVGLLVVPFVVAVDMAERRGFSTWRCGLLTLACLGVGAGGILALRHHSPLLLVPCAALCWAVPGLLSLLSEDQKRLGGRQGGHEP